MQKDMFANRQTNDACKEMCLRIDDHENMCSRTDEGANMQGVFMNGRTDEHAPFANEQICQAYQHTSKEQCVNATSSKPMTIADSMHFSMWR